MTGSTKEFVNSASSNEIARRLGQLAQAENDGALKEIQEFLVHRDDDTYGKHITPRIAARALLQKGTAGVEMLLSTISKAPGAIYPQAIIEALWYASRGEYASIPMFEASSLPQVLRSDLPVPTRASAEEAIQDLVIESASNADLFQNVFGFFFGALQRTEPQREQELRTRVLEVLSESTIKLTRRLLRDFSGLIQSNEREEVYQQCFQDHPVLIDPLASRIIPKQKLGLELVTDFVVERHDQKYIVLEIERPQDKIFTGDNDITARFSHAFGQIVDFQAWVDANIAYAQKLLPRISSPQGLLIMGRRTELTQANSQKLHPILLQQRTY